jgi:spore maturation protein CgeB
VRGRKLLALARAGFSVRVWGNGWERMSDSHPRLRLERRPLFNDDYVRAICATKINLCFLRKANRDLQTDRTMEIPACGAFMLAERTAEHRRLFEEDREAVFFDIDDDRELIDKARRYLQDDAARRAVAAAARRRCEVSAYSHHDRVGGMLKECDAIR